MNYELELQLSEREERELNYFYLNNINHLISTLNYEINIRKINKLIATKEELLKLAMYFYSIGYSAFGTIEKTSSKRTISTKKLNELIIPFLCNLQGWND